MSNLWIEKLIPINPFSRKGEKLESVKKIVNHYTANPGASSHNHFVYFGKSLIEKNMKLPPKKRRFASAHIFVDKNEAYLIVPLDEVAFHCNDGTYRGIPELKPNGNYKSIGVELCIEDDGSFHPETIRRAEEINAELCRMFNLDPIEDVVTHHQVTKKPCPLPWINKPQDFIDFKNSVKKRLVVNEEDENLVVLTASQWRMLGDSYKKAHELGILSSEEWHLRAYKKELTLSEIGFLNAVIMMNKGK